MTIQIHFLQESPYSVERDVKNEEGVRGEEVVVDPRDKKLVVFNWNKEGRDSSGTMQAVLDYNKATSFDFVSETIF